MVLSLSEFGKSLQLGLPTSVLLASRDDHTLSSEICFTNLFTITHDASIVASSSSLQLRLASVPDINIGFLFDESSRLSQLHLVLLAANVEVFGRGALSSTTLLIVKLLHRDRRSF